MQLGCISDAACEFEAAAGANYYCNAGNCLPCDPICPLGVACTTWGPGVSGCGAPPVTTAATTPAPTTTTTTAAGVGMMDLNICRLFV